MQWIYTCPNGGTLSGRQCLTTASQAASVTPSCPQGWNTDGQTCRRMQQRYYDPVAGRFLSTDPVVTDADTGKSFNRYTYGLNNPYRYIDPDGRQSVGSMPTTSRMGYLDMGIRAWYGKLIDQGKTTLAVVSMVLGGPEAKLGKEAIAVTESSIKAALKGSEMKTTQESISLPMVKDYVAKLEAGEVAPAIKVDGKTIVDGNHRFVAGEVAGKPVSTTAGTAAPSQLAKSKPIEEIKISPKDFRDPK